MQLVTDITFRSWQHSTIQLLFFCSKLVSKTFIYNVLACIVSSVAASVLVPK